MADDGIRVDLTELLEDYARTNAELTTRALLAEAKCRAYARELAGRERGIAELTEKVAGLEHALEASVALGQDECP
jgi:hypothetical protein